MIPSWITRSRFWRRWRAILAEHDWELVCVLVGVLSQARGLSQLFSVWPLPGHYAPSLAGIPTELWDLIFVLAGVMMIGGVYWRRSAWSRAGSLAASLLWLFHAYYYTIDFNPAHVLTMAVLAAASMSVFLRSNQHPWG